MKSLFTLFCLFALSPLLFAQPAAPATCTAIKAAPLPAGVASIWTRNGSAWAQRSTLRVRFLTGSKRQKEQAWQRMAAIDELVNLTFVQVTTGAAEIRVRFDRDKGHWSYVGVAARAVPSNAPTMNLALMAGVFGDTPEEWDRVTWHETLHAIGIEHEHQHPKAGIPWTKEAVYRYYASTQGWSREQIDFQVLNRYRGTGYQGTSFDRESIMLYPVPESLTTNGFSVGWNKALSATDIAFLRTLYPS